MTEKVFDTGDSYVFACPHCGDLTQVLKNQVNCKIFRHATHFVTLPSTPHTFSREYRENVAEIFDTLLFPGHVTEEILTYTGELPKYIPTEPVNPHLPKSMCDALVAEGKILGCAKPFRLVFTPQGNYAEICDYI